MNNHTKLCFSIMSRSYWIICFIFLSIIIYAYYDKVYYTTVYFNQLYYSKVQLTPENIRPMVTRKYWINNQGILLGVYIWETR
jgi:hypothetical protein